MYMYIYDKKSLRSSSKYPPQSCEALLLCYPHEGVKHVLVASLLFLRESENKNMTSKIECLIDPKENLDCQDDTRN